ncbi:hypothetical protein ASE00_19800 [Sphingomonas sp. Root710]|uniref:hypothetical protein n=1 Tax=Sphingomonas sp. Root710 TaxID=1736594 RepID=UPI000700BB52|nr:hypothetical protein [Sphingomonas sp. Root710]KRB79356.1 hypothetical protein ASE00_19800 [Sphingomonas sp. Root710]
MLLAALLLAATPVEAAERAFASKAQTDGQWTAFRAFAAPDAVSFAPEIASAGKLFGTLKDPPVAVMWWPSRTILSCDGSSAISTGPWVRKGGRQTGTFTTVWQRQADGAWKWRLDHGRETPRAVRAHDPVEAVRASCARIVRPAAPDIASGPTPLAVLIDKGDPIVQFDGRMPAGRDAPDITLAVGERLDGGASVDGTLRWVVHAIHGADKGAHLLIVHRFDGRGWPVALIDVVGVPIP